MNASTYNGFESLADARTETEAWREEYNETRLHSSSGIRAPAQYIAELLGIGTDSRSQQAKVLT